MTNNKQVKQEKKQAELSSALRKNLLRRKAVKKQKNDEREQSEK